MIDSAFYEQEQKHFGESNHHARGKHANCPHLGLIVGQFTAGQDFAYFSSIGGTGVYSRDGVFAYWPPRTTFDPFDPNAVLRPRGFWTFDITINVYFPLPSGSELPGLPIRIARFDPAFPLLPVNPPYDDRYIVAGQYGELLREHGDDFIAEPLSNWIPPEDGYNPSPGSGRILGRPSFVIPANAVPGTFTKHLTLRTTMPPPYCHPAFGIQVSELGFRYYPCEWQNAPVLGPGAANVPIWDLTCIVRRVFPFHPAIRINQTRFNFSTVNQAEITNPSSDRYRVEFTEVGYTDNGAKNNWTWNFDGASIGGLPNMVREYAGAGQHSVAVTVYDGNGDPYSSGTQLFVLKTVEWSVTNGAGGIRNFSSAAINPGNSRVSSYRWTFATGITPAETLAISTEANPTFDFGSAIDAMASLQVVFADGTFYRTPFRYV